MFNLLMSGNDEAFLGKTWILERNRVFEYTSDAIAARFRDLTPENLEELYRLPSLMAYERSCNQAARLGKMNRILIRPAEIRIEYSIIPGLPEIQSEELFGLEWELDIQRFEGGRRHWAIKDVDLRAELIAANIIREAQFRALPAQFQALFMENQPGPELHVQPSVFRIPDAAQEPNLVSVMIPFDDPFKPVFEAIQNAGQQIGLRVLNANQVWEETEIFQDIFSLIYRSKFVICDFSQQNPNVFYEAGIAHTLGRPVIPVVQNVEHIPFDLRHHRHVIYLNNAEGLDKLIEEISPRMRSLAAG